MINTHWGGVTEDNSFGTHEFLDLCEQLDAEPVICGNVGSGSVEEMSKWVEYINFDGVSPMADLRRANGRDKPWNVKYWGVGNENWGCGGNMTADFYADQYRRYATFARNYGDNRLMKIAGGANSTDYNWTEVLMRDVPHNLMWGISLHYYTTNWNNKGSATKFTEKEYFETVERCLNVEKALDRHITVIINTIPQNGLRLWWMSGARGGMWSLAPIRDSSSSRIPCVMQWLQASRLTISTRGVTGSGWPILPRR